MRIFRHQIRRRIKVAAPQNRIVFVSAVRGDQKLAFFAFVERLYHPVKVFGRNVRHVGRDQQRAVAGGGHRFQPQPDGGFDARSVVVVAQYVDVDVFQMFFQVFRVMSGNYENRRSL